MKKSETVLNIKKTPKENKHLHSTPLKEINAYVTKYEMSRIAADYNPAYKSNTFECCVLKKKEDESLITKPIWLIL